MNILDLAEELSLAPQKVASTNGGEYKSRCPQCQDGKDRFCIWPHQGPSGRYWCRVCDCKGDGIQFCKDFLGMSYHLACQTMDLPPKFQKRQISLNPFRVMKFLPQITEDVNQKWQQAGDAFVKSSHKRLMSSSDILNLLFRRGFSLDTIHRCSLGWNPDDLFEEREKWGLSQAINGNGRPRRQWIPKGIVIPSYKDNKLIKLKIRRTEWYSEDDLPKYIEVSGSKKCPSIYGDIPKPVIIVESELDAMLIQQHASHLICGIALGGVSKKPDQDLHAFLKKSPLILLSLDFDDSGKKRYAFWMKLYPNLRPWPSPKGKSLGDAVQFFQVDILKWIKKGLSTS